MNEKFKKFSAATATVFNRAVQFTEEKLGSAEKTEHDKHFENLMSQYDKTKVWTERIIKQTETVIQPNPNNKIEDILKKKEGLTQTEQLGQYLMEAGEDLGQDTKYGHALVRCGQAQRNIGNAEKECMQSTLTNFLQPLRNFLDGDMKTITKEKKILETKRLDLDGCKSRLRKIELQINQNQAAPGAKDPVEAELQARQSEFDRQVEITKILLEGINSTHAHHLRCLTDFIEAQMTYFSQCKTYITELQKNLG